uniref:Uncharacterized protein n=1 Tax=Arundo donax TaxID=35708 RepID=A0A0A9AZH1_ARUDO
MGKSTEFFFHRGGRYVLAADTGLISMTLANHHFRS